MSPMKEINTQQNLKITHFRVIKQIPYALETKKK